MSKATYRSLCRMAALRIPLFSQDWWLDAACGEANWEVLLIESGSGIEAAWPLYTPLKTIVTMPPYTQTMGIWFAPDAPDTKYASAIERRQALCRQLLEKLGQRKAFMQRFHHSFTDWLPFYWEGYTQTTRYTYLLNELHNRDRLLSNMNQNVRRNLRKAREQSHITVKRGIAIDDFIRIQSLTFARQGIRNRENPEILSTLVAVCRQRNCGDLWGGYDADGHLHAVAFIAWDHDTAYYLAGGGDPALRDSGAHSLVLWEAICQAAEVAERFDFEGSMLPGVERFFRGFGGIQTPYFAISNGRPSLLDRIRIKCNRR